MVDAISNKTSFMTKPHFLDGRDATNVKPEMGLSWVQDVKKNITEKISVGYNNGMGSKGDYPAGDNLFAAADSTTRVSAAAPGLHCYFRQLGENTENPDMSYTTFESFATPTKMDLYC